MGQFRREGGSDRGSRDFGGNRGGYGRERSFGGDRGEKTMHRATCAECGRSCEVPFKPSGDKPVYCSECFGNQQSSDYGRDSRRESRSFERPRFEDKKMFTATCDKCGEKCEIPFRPTAGKPVFCNSCFGKGGDTKSAGKSDCQCKDNFSILNAKLDRIIKALNIPESKKEAPKKAMDEIAELIEEIATATKPEKKAKKAKVEKKVAVKTKAEPKKKAVAKKKK